MLGLVIEKASAHEIQGEINKNAGEGWELFSFQVVLQGTAPSTYQERGEAGVPIAHC